MTDKQTIWDPLRKRHVALTPEERVRQWCIGVLSNDLGVPMHMMMSEVRNYRKSRPKECCNNRYKHGWSWYRY